MLAAYMRRMDWLARQIGLHAVNAYGEAISKAKEKPLMAKAVRANKMSASTFLQRAGQQISA